MSQRVEEKLKLDTKLMIRTKQTIVDIVDDKLRKMGLDEVSIFVDPNFLYFFNLIKTVSN